MRPPSIIPIFLFASLCLTWCLHAQSSVEPEGLTKIRIKWQQARSKSASKIDRTYQKQLKKLLALYKSKGDLEGSLAVKEELVFVAQLLERLAKHQEQAPGGRELKIYSATWGRGGKYLDVTAIVKKQVRAGRVQFRLNSKTLGDPYPGKDKFLRVSYRVGGGKMIAKSIRQNSILNIP